MAQDYIAKPTRKRAPSFKVEWKVLAVVAIFIGLLELLSRYLAPTLDSAAEHIHAFPSLVQEVKQVEEQKQGARSVLLFGNSLMMHGLNQDKLEQSLPASVATTKMTPVGTTIVDWTYLYKRYFENQNTHPDVMVVGFVRHHIADAAQAYPIRNRRLGRHFLASEDQPLIWKTELTNFHDRVQTSLAHYSSLIGDQPEHHVGILQTVIASYSSGLSANNDWVNAWKSRKKEEWSKGVQREAPPVTYHRLKRFIELMKSHDVEVWFVPMPQPTFYPLDQEIIAIVEANGMKWLDARELCIGESFFSDGYHLGESGNERFTHWLSEHIKGLLDKG